MSETVIKCESVYKIFGQNAKKMLEEANGNVDAKTFQEKGKCFAGFTVSGNNVGVNESITISGEALSFLSTGIDTRVYFIKNF